MKKNLKKILSGAASATLLASQAVAFADTQAVEAEAQATAYDEIANVQGEFSFNQDVLSPADEVFNLFGTAATGVCAKPSFAMNDADIAEKYFVNVGGKLRNEYTTTLADLKAKGGESKITVCSCSMSNALAQTKVTGARVSDILELAGVMDDANAISFVSADGYKSTMPLEYALENEAMLVWQIADKENPNGLQVWMPSTAAKYFTRQVTELEVFHTDEALNVEKPQGAKVSILNHMDDAVAVGDGIVFEGFADDCGTAIAAVEFSLDGGKTWTTCKTENADPKKWVAWSFGYVAEAPGSYKLDVRAVAADGTVSPLASSVTFTVA
ncbi:MAG: molybdopterin-dependent oxidoreductase [Clostridia bacterium]|nr:molybdopterin-dependent oxidoreductase [Clostridia bacterium]